MKFKFAMQDWIIVVTSLFFLGAHLTTIFLSVKNADLIGDVEDAKVYNKMREASPLAALLIQSVKASFIFTIIIIPSYALTFYYVIRMRFMRSKPWLVSMALVFFLIASFRDFTNDLAVLAGLMLR